MVRRPTRVVHLSHPLPALIVGALLVGCASSPPPAEPRVNAGLDSFSGEGQVTTGQGGVDPSLRPSSQVDLASIFEENAQVLPSLSSGDLDEGRESEMVGEPSRTETNIASVIEAPPSRPGESASETAMAGETVEPELKPSSTPAIQSPGATSRYERVVAELSSILGRFTDTSDNPLEAAARLSVVEALEPGSTRQARDVHALSPREIDILESWRNMHTRLGEGLSSDPAEAIDELTFAVSEAARRMNAWTPLDVTKVALCTKVSGYGVYNELPTKRLLAGRVHPLIIYVEIENFTTSVSSGPDGQTGFQVELEEELQLFHEADGVLAWRQPVERINDFSRNRRRDFFLAQLIELPAELTVGAYRLKVRVTDRATDAVSEAIIPIEIVADAALVRAPED